jgi:hypothetical protein
VLPRAYHWLDAIPQLGPGAVRRLLRMLATLERAIPVYAPIRDLLRAAGARRAARVAARQPRRRAGGLGEGGAGARRAQRRRGGQLGQPHQQGLLRIRPDQVLVWNDAQRHEARTYHDIPDDRIAVTGAQLFDRWFEGRPSTDRAAFCRRVGLPDDRPFVLFTGSSGFISESSAEVAFVRRWLQALRASNQPSVRDVNVLVRRIPTTATRGKRIR